MADHDAEPHSKNAITFWHDYWLLWSATLATRTLATGAKENVIKNVASAILKGGLVRKQAKNIKMITDEDASSQKSVPLVQTTEMREKILTAWRRHLTIAEPLDSERVEQIVADMEDALDRQFTTYRNGSSTSQSVLCLCMSIARHLRKDPWLPISDEEIELLEDNTMSLNWRTSTLRNYLVSMYNYGSMSNAPDEKTVIKLLNRTVQNAPPKDLIFNWDTDWDEPSTQRFFERFKKSLDAEGHPSTNRYEEYHFKKAQAVACQTPSVVAHLLCIAEIPTLCLIVMFNCFLQIYENSIKVSRDARHREKYAHEYNQVENAPGDVFLDVARKMHAQAMEIKEQHFKKFYDDYLIKAVYKCIRTAPQVVKLFVQNPLVPSALLSNESLLLKMCHWNFRQRVFTPKFTWSIKDFSRNTADLLQTLVGLISDVHSLADAFMNTKGVWPKDAEGENVDSMTREDALQCCLSLLIKGGMVVVSEVVERWEWPSTTIVDCIPLTMQIMDDHQAPIGPLATMMSRLSASEKTNQGFLWAAVRCKNNPAILQTVLKGTPPYEWYQEELAEAMAMATTINNRGAVRTLLNAPYKVMPIQAPPPWVLEMVEELYAPGGEAFEAVCADNSLGS